MGVCWVGMCWVGIIWPVGGSIHGYFGRCLCCNLADRPTPPWNTVHPTPPTHLQVTSGGTFDWRTAEAALYCVRAVHRCAPLPGDALMMSLFSSLPMLPAVPQLQYTVALTVGAYSDWLSDTAQRGEEGRTLLSQVGRVCSRRRGGLSCDDEVCGGAGAVLGCF